MIRTAAFLALTLVLFGLVYLFIAAVVDSSEEERWRE